MEHFQEDFAGIYVGRLMEAFAAKTKTGHPDAVVGVFLDKQSSAAAF